MVFGVKLFDAVSHCAWIFVGELAKPYHHIANGVYLRISISSSSGRCSRYRYFPRADDDDDNTRYHASQQRPKFQRPRPTTVNKTRGSGENRVELSSEMINALSFRILIRKFRTVIVRDVYGGESFTYSCAQPASIPIRAPPLPPSDTRVM